METLERKSHIPKSERELIEVQEGELVKISFRDDHGVNGTTSKWTRYLGFKEGKDHFEYQEPAKCEEDTPLVIIKSSQRDIQQYDITLGVVLNHLYEETEFIGPIRNKEIYDKKVQELKDAGIWRE